MKKPLYLRAGDTVWITATARKITLHEIQPAISLLNKWGYQVKVGKSIGLENHQFAGTDEERAQDFQIALDDPETNAIWCARGGYGTVKMLDKLDFKNFLRNPKWIIGYSDITILHSHLHNLGVESLHATMPIDLKKIQPSALKTLKRALSGESIVYKVPSVPENKLGKSKGQLVGGNLSVLFSAMGSSSTLNTTGKILFLEDLDEYLYHMDRMLMNLQRNGYFEELSGLIIGGMVELHDNSIPFGKNIKEIILDITSAYDFPVVFNFPAGHLEDNRALIFGRVATLEVDEKQTIININS